MKRWGEWIVLFFFAMLPWDISKVLFPPYQSAPETPTTLTFVRIAMLLLVAWGGLRYLQGGIIKTTVRLGRTPLFWAILPLFGAALLSLSGSLQPRTTVTETLRLLILLALGISLALGVQNRKTFDRVWKVFCGVMTLAALFGLLQYFTGQWIWGGGINELGVKRVNSSFIDPNIFARYLNISILGTLALMVQKEWKLNALSGLMLLLQTAALVVTFSRTGWLILFLGVVILAFLSSRSKRLGILAGGGALALILLLIPAFRDRLATLASGIGAIGQREHLLKGGWAMFMAHPLTGVGLGNFQWAIENPFHYLVPWTDAVTRSHTSLITVMAEMGTLGLLAMLFFLIMILAMNHRVMGQMRGYSLAVTFGILIIWLSSQGEGRFFEDPLVWAFWGLSLALQWKHWGEDWDE